VDGNLHYGQTLYLIDSQGEGTKDHLVTHPGSAAEFSEHKPADGIHVVLVDGQGRIGLEIP
jgi:hypothetical protein